MANLFNADTVHTAWATRGEPIPGGFRWEAEAERERLPFHVVDCTTFREVCSRFGYYGWSYAGPDPDEPLDAPNVYLFQRPSFDLTELLNHIDQIASGT